MDGFIVVNKPAGPTSHDVVAHIRRLAGTRQVGHGGTLDPDAEGVLVVAIGKATRTLPFLRDTGKTYLAGMRLGTATDTLDASGTVVERATCFTVTRTQMMAALHGFVGPIEQIPPMYSAVKIRGQKLYALARKGQVIERSPRPVMIRSIEIIDRHEQWGPGDLVSLQVDCSAGTYVRTLCDDIGRRLGCLAHMATLVRTRSGDFSIEQATGLSTLESRPDDLTGLLTPISHALGHLAEKRLDEASSERVRHGTRVPASDGASGEIIRLVDPAGILLALAKVLHDDTGLFWQPVCVLA